MLYFLLHESVDDRNCLTSWPYWFLIWQIMVEMLLWLIILIAFNLSFNVSYDAVCGELQEKCNVFQVEYTNECGWVFQRIEWLVYGHILGYSDHQSTASVFMGNISFFILTTFGFISTAGNYTVDFIFSLTSKGSLEKEQENLKSWHPSFASLSLSKYNLSNGRCSS